MNCSEPQTDDRPSPVEDKAKPNLTSKVSLPLVLGDKWLVANSRGQSAVRGGALEASRSGQEQRTGSFPSGAGLHSGHPETPPKTGSGFPRS